MPAYLVTGENGTGKSAVAAALRADGYTAYDTDHMAGLSYARDPVTGKTVTLDPNRPQEASKLDWLWDKAKLKVLLDQPGDVFICAITNNQEQFYPLFKKLFVLTLDKKTLTERLLTRTTEDYGKQPDELDQILDAYKSFTNKAIAAGAIPINADRHVDHIAEDIVRHIK